MKTVIFANEARTKLLEGINLVSKAVAATIGPKGRNAVLSRDTAPPIITNDGVSIASYFNKVEDPYVNTGVQMIKEVSAKQNEPGDGTTTATILASALVNEGNKYILSGHDPIKIKNGIQKAADETIEALKNGAKQIETVDELIQIATISVEDVESGRMIGEMMHEVGMDGAITVETHKGVKLEKDMAQGIKFDQGFLTPYFMTNPYRQEAVYEQTPILVTDHVIYSNSQVSGIADQLLQAGIKGLVIVCENMKGEALTTVVKNTIEGRFHFLVVRLPGFDIERMKKGEDIAVAAGAKFIHADIDKLEDVKLEDLGGADRIISTNDTTIIVNGSGTKEDIKNRVKVLKEEIKHAISDFDRDQLKERIARLSGGIGVIRVGAATEQELTYKKHKIEDALAATRAAVEEGIVQGGGVALLSLSKESEDIGEKIFFEAIKEPIKKIAENAGKNPETVVERIVSAHKDGFKSIGWDAKNDEFVDMIAFGIVDPVKVTRKAIENAVSMATMFLTSESLIVEVPDLIKKENNGPKRP